MNHLHQEIRAKCELINTKYFKRHTKDIMKKMMIELSKQGKIGPLITLVV